MPKTRKSAKRKKTSSRDGKKPRKKSAPSISAKQSNIRKKKYARGKHPNTLKNLKPFKPGQSGNPSGKPKGTRDLIKIMRREMFKPYTGPDAKPGQTMADKIMEKAIEMSASGSHKHMLTLLERLVGKVPDRVQIDTNPLAGRSDEELDELMENGEDEEEEDEE